MFVFYNFTVLKLHFFKCVLSHNGVQSSRIADEVRGFHLWKISANVLNKQPQKPDKRGASYLRGGHGAETPHSKKIILRNITRGLAIGWIFGDDLR
jgi:hypothetical protein